MGPQKAARRNEWHCSINEELKQSTLFSALLGRGLIAMQTDRYRDEDRAVSELVLPSTLRVGEEAMNKFVGEELASNCVEFCGLNAAASFPSYSQISATNFHGADRFMEGIPLTTSSVGTNPNGLDCIGSSMETMFHGYGGLLPFDSSKCIAPSELVGRVVVGRTRPPPPPAAQSARIFHPREWMMSSISNELSLSLVTSRPSVLLGNSLQEQCSELLSSSSEHASCSSKNLSSRFDAHKPHQLPPLLSGARFLEAMQEILAEFACYALENFEDGVSSSYSSSCVAGRAAIGSSNGHEADHAFVFQKQETSLETKKNYLLALLQMVDEQYSQCLDEIHTVTSAFHAVTELDPNLHVRFALPTISLMYKSLRERISSHILAAGAQAKEGRARENKSFEACFLQKQWALQQLSKRDHQLWRPQRGLPETSVSVLRTWMFQNFLHPYPKDSEKHLLALKSGLTRNQVSNWFINARVRLWKPMIEEMCAEMNRRKARKDDEDMESNHRNQMHLEARRFTRD